MPTYIIVPAAGGGTRMQQDTPKQYLPLDGQCILERTLHTLLSVPDIHQVIVALAPHDAYFDTLAICQQPRLTRITGGASRAASVLQALNHLTATAHADDWVLVHDAARPLVRLSDIATLRATLHDHPIGGILATPVSDTLKQVDTSLNIHSTIDRSILWRALTPQMARYGLLKAALSACLTQGIKPTDEAQALEQAGFTPRIVEGCSDNIKITYPMDLLLAEQIVRAGFGQG